jgi:fatty acid-binding protein DegV
MMNKVATTTTSAHIFAEEAKIHGFDLVPFHIIMDDKDYLNTKMDVEALYARLDEEQNLPTSSTPTVAEILQVWQGLSRSAEAILHIAMTQAFTGVYNLALQAEELKKWS